MVGSRAKGISLGATLEFRLLGPVEVTAGGSTVPLGGPKQRALLALLLLHRGEAVARDTLIDALWGERPPASAATALHGYVSQLRKLLEPDRRSGAPPAVLVTREPGYELRAEAEQIDVERFRRVATEGRDRLAAGDPAGASTLLHEALALWRGPALADIAAEPALAADVARLEEERAAALGDRIDADLELGRHAALVGELEKVVGAAPLRERPRAQLIVALYRCGRQADALAAFRAARRTLVDEVGIEPGPALRELERLVLAQDPALDLPASGRSPQPRAEPQPQPQPEPAESNAAEPRPRRRRVRRRGAAVAAATLVAVVAATTLALGGGGHSRAHPVPVSGNSVASIDPATATVAADVPVGGTPTAIAAGEGAVWVLNADDQTVSRIDPSSREAKTFGTGGVPTDLAAGEGGLWVGNGRRDKRQFVGPSATSVSRFDPNTTGLRTTVSLPRSAFGRSNTNTDHLAVGAGSVWAVGPDFSVSRIDPGTTEVISQTRPIGAEAVAAGPEGVWTLTTSGALVRLDRRGPRIDVAASALAGLAVGEGAVWAVAPYEGVLWRVDSQAQQLVARPIRVGHGASAVTVGAGSVWVANALRGTVSRVDPRRGRVTATIKVGGTPRRLAAAGGRIWVTVAGNPRHEAAAPGDAHVQGLPEAVCGKVFYGGTGRPDGLIVSDMPLRGGRRLPTQQMSDAIAYVLRGRGFRAGRLRVGYQSCDDSTEQSGIFDPDKCAANAKSFADTKIVLGEIGPFNSGCALAQIPVAGAAPEGPLAMIGPTNTQVGLTRPGTGRSPSQVAALYPGGRRNFARLPPDESVQGAADAIEAKRLGAHSAFVVSDSGYGIQPAVSFMHAARRIGVRVLDIAEWREGAGRYDSLARRVARAHPDAVFVSGVLDTGGGRVLAALRGALGPRVHLLASDGLLPVSALFRDAGAAARGVHLSFPGLTNDVLGPAGRHFLAQFRATQPGGRVSEAAIYAAQSAGLLLDAIGRSDGTRASITAELFRTNAEGGIVGSVRFDAHGDAVAAPVTIVRAERAGGSDEVLSTEGAAVERVVLPRRGLGD